MNLLRVLYLVVQFVFDLELMARVGRFRVSLCLKPGKKSLGFWCGFYLDEKDSNYISVVPIVLLSSLRFYCTC